MPAAARRHLRKMRGGAQAQLIETEDGRCWVVKFTNNPQHRRILINEVIAATCLEYLQVATPRHAVVAVDDAFLDAFPACRIQLGQREERPAAGWHFGSLFPGDPDKLAVYDFLPDALLPKVENLADFAGMLVADKWLGNTDARQAIFFRGRLREWLGETRPPLQKGFVALMIDHGFAFNGPQWDFPDSPLQGLYFRPHAYADLQGMGSLEPWLGRLRSLPESVLDEAWRRIPDAWLTDADAAHLPRLLERLHARRLRIEGLLEASVAARPTLFPNWR